MKPEAPASRPPGPGLRVGLTGGLGSGKSTVASMLAARGATIFSADELARQLMQPGQAVFAAIVAQFGPEVLRPDGTLDRPALARLAFSGGRVEELNAIVHPATIALQRQLTAQVFADNPAAIVVVESALIFETRFSEPTSHHQPTHAPANPQVLPVGSPNWPHRFDRIVLVTAPDELKIARFVARSTSPGAAAAAELQAEARRRLSRMIPDDVKAARCDFILPNDRSLAELDLQVDALWTALEAARHR